MTLGQLINRLTNSHIFHKWEFNNRETTYTQPDTTGVDYADSYQKAWDSIGRNTETIIDHYICRDCDKRKTKFISKQEV